MGLSVLKVVFRKGIIKTVPLFCLIISVVIACNNNKRVLPFYNSADFTAEWINQKDANYQSLHTIDTFSLTNQLGHLITKDSLDGNIYVANFFFTSCTSICPKMVNNLQYLQDTFADNKDFKLVSFTVTPEEDSVEILKNYGEIHTINPSKWYLLTGNKDEIYKLGRMSYFAEKELGLKKDSSDFLHTESMLLIDKKGRIRGIYNATQKADINRIIDDIRVLMRNY